MIDMKRKPKKDENEAKCGCCHPVTTDYEEGYPWGLRISLNSESLKTLGLTAESFQSGAMVNLTAQAKVFALRTPADGKDNQEVELQITALDLQGGLLGKGAKFLKEQAKGPGGEA